MVIAACPCFHGSNGRPPTVARVPKKSRSAKAQTPAPLRDYRAKRTASRTPEPFGAAAAASTEQPGEPRLFVVQKHSARRLHYDFRLELGGVPLAGASTWGGRM